MARTTEMVLKGKVRSLGQWKEPVRDLRELNYEKREIMQIKFWRCGRTWRRCLRIS